MHQLHGISPERQAAAIESKRRLLAFVETRPNLNLESFICLASLLQSAGWKCENKLWRKDDRSLSVFEASEVELRDQIAVETERLLKRTVQSYGPANASD